MLKARYVGMAAYNRWANERIYAAAAEVSLEDLRRDCGAFFKSVLGTLNHLVVTDRLWLARFNGDVAPPYTLDHILFDELEPLRKARIAEDDRIVAFVDRQSESSLFEPVTYRTVTNPMTISQPLAPALDHFFNHQTHHRGQVHALLTRLTGAAPSVDLILLQRELGSDGLTATR
ncbi:MAG: DinB family protein [Beijerinckiaceae bacterium]|nr:DinB family protein [Beijerinckiaceae bacterium]